MYRRAATHCSAFVLVLAGVLAACSDGTDPMEASPAAPEMVVAPANGLVLHVNTLVQAFTQIVFDPCTGENVQITSDLHLLHRVSVDGQGVQHDVFHTNFTNVSAVGLSTGNAYRATSAETAQSSFWVSQNPPVDFKSTHELTLHLIANPGSDLMVHGIFIVSRTDGVFDFKVIRIESTCHGGV